MCLQFTMSVSVCQVSVCEQFVNSRWKAEGLIKVTIISHRETLDLCCSRLFGLSLCLQFTMSVSVCQVPNCEQFVNWFVRGRRCSDCTYSLPCCAVLVK